MPGWPHSAISVSAPGALAGPTPRLAGTAPGRLGWRPAMGSLIKKRRKRMRKKKHKKMLKATRWQRRAGR